ncbi:MAG TPA: O-antigen ligase family protein [Methylovirgula sp.]|nr:O-antigen ligase family protein [Methylovirgula sp.]
MPRGTRHTAILGRRDETAWTVPIVKSALVLMAVFASTNLSEAIIPGGEQSNFQQYIVVALWGLLIAVSYFRRTLLHVDLAATGTWLGIAFYAFAMLSALWANEPLSSLTKSVALAITTFGAYRLVKTVSLKDIVECSVHGMFVLAFLSIVFALFVPSIGVSHDWQHPGQWSGIFPNKQALGLVAAVLLFLACNCLMSSPRKFYYGAAAAAGLICIIGSESRGAGALAVISAVGVYYSGRSVIFARILAFTPFVMSLCAIVLITYMVQTGNPTIDIFNAHIDFTERTYIWQHALSYFPTRPWIGFGLDGFWTIKEVKDVFIERHGWFLDNYHDGYIGILVETGVVGFSLFVACYFLFAYRILAAIRRDGRLMPDIALAAMFTSLLFFIDFTETYFLRSTNIAATLLNVCFFIAYARRSAPHAARLYRPAHLRAAPVYAGPHYGGQESSAAAFLREAGYYDEIV